jgi:hypothetical protein
VILVVPYRSYFQVFRQELVIISINRVFLILRLLLPVDHVTADTVVPGYRYQSGGWGTAVTDREIPPELNWYKEEPALPTGSELIVFKRELHQRIYRRY